MENLLEKLQDTLLKHGFEQSTNTFIKWVERDDDRKYMVNGEPVKLPKHKERYELELKEAKMWGEDEGQPTPLYGIQCTINGIGKGDYYFDSFDDAVGFLRINGLL